MKNGLRLDIRNHYPIMIVGVVFAILLSSLSLGGHALFRTHAFDLGIYNQAIYHYAHGEVASSTIRHVPNLLGDHFEILLIPLSLLYWILGSYTALGIQVLAVVVGGIGVYASARQAGASRWIATGAATVLYAGYGVWSALGFDFHNNLLGAMLIPWIYYALDGRHPKLLAALFLALLLTKENMALLAAFLAFGHALFGRPGTRRSAVVAAVVAAVFFVVVIELIIPGLNNVPFYAHWQYAALGDGPGDALAHVLTHPIQTAALLFDHPDKLRTWMFFLLAGGAFVIFQPRLLVLLLPIMGQKLFSTDSSYWGTGFHYSVELSAVAALAVGWTLAAWPKQVARAAATFFVGSNLVLLHSMGFGRILTPSWYNVAYARTDLTQALALVPAEAPVSAQDSIVPHLAARDRIYLYPDVNDARFVVLNSKDPSLWPMLDSAALDREIMVMDRLGIFERTYERGGVIVWQRIVAEPVPTGAFCSRPDNFQPGFLATRCP